MGNRRKKIRFLILTMCVCSYYILGLGVMAGCAGRTVTQTETEKTNLQEANIQELNMQETNPQETEERTLLFGEFTASDVDRNPVTSEIFSNCEVNMVYIWATYSEECMAQLGSLEELYQEYQERFGEGMFQVIGIPVDTLDQSGSASNVQLHEVREILRKNQASFLQIIPSFDLVTAVLKDVSSVPMIVFVDKDGGQLGETYQENMDKESWMGIIEEVFSEYVENKKVA